MVDFAAMLLVVPRRSNLMNSHERAICARVKQFRELIKWSQPDFAKEIGISRDQLANIEYCRSPLRYALAVTVCHVFDINGQWLAEGQGEMRGGEHALWVVDVDLKSHFNSTFFEVYQKNPDVFKPFRQGKEPLVSAPTPGFDPEAWLMRKVFDWFHYNKFPDPVQAELFARQIESFAQAIMRDFRQKGKAIWPRWAPESFPFIPANPLNKIPEGIEEREPKDIYRLTTSSEIRKVGGVITEMQKLLSDVRKLVTEKGAKAKLAGYLEVPQSRLSEWLGGKYEPSGEIALRLSKWVSDNQKRQLK
jgi:transcriptional regulator with XRE-family HTH domain